MSVPDTEESLINSLSRLCAINPNGARNVNETENTPQYDENFQNKVSTILEAVKKSEKYVDPKIKATREKLPIFKKKEELIRVSILKFTTYNDSRDAFVYLVVC